MQKARRLILPGKIVFTHILLISLLSAAGCGPKPSSDREMFEFEKAGLVTAQIDFDGTNMINNNKGPYRVIAGDTLEFQMPVILRIISSDLSLWLRPVSGHKDVEPYIVRVSQTGTITLPIVSQLHVSGKTLAEIEELVIEAYHPKYVVNIPMVVCEVSKYQHENERVFTVLGLVNKPDAFPYPPDIQYNLMEALAFAGGLDMVADPRFVKIYRQDTSGEIVSATFGVDQKSLAEAYTVAVKPGDVIYVDHTFRTRFNKFIADVFQVRVGAGYSYK